MIIYNPLIKINMKYAKININYKRFELWKCGIDLPFEADRDAD